MHSILGRLLRWLTYIAAAGVMLLALLVGIARLLLPLVPDYQNEIRRWAGEATGLDVDFQYISASWPFTGPELRFMDVTISSRDDNQLILDAETLTVGVSVKQFLFNREITLSRIGIEASQLEIGRDESGSLVLQGQPIADLVQLKARPGEQLAIPDINIELTEIEVTYEDSGRTDMVLDFVIEQLELRLSSEEIVLDGEIELDAELGDHVALSLNFPVELMRSDSADRGRAEEGPGDDKPVWEFFMAGEELQVHRILELALDMEVPVLDSDGDIVIWAKFAGLEPSNITAELDLSDIELAGANGQTESYQALRGQLEWARMQRGWLLAGSDLRITRGSRGWPDGDFSVTYRNDEDSESGSVSASASFLRLDDLYPLVMAVATEDVRTTLLPRDVHGDLHDLDLNLNLNAEGPANFDLEVRFEQLGFADVSAGNSGHGVSGTVVADQNGGRVQIDSEGSQFYMPAIFAEPIDVDSVNGFLVWRVTDKQIRVLSDNVQIRTPYLVGNSRFELSVPRNGDSPRIDLTASAMSSDASRILNYLPLQKFKPKFVKWLRRSVVKGRLNGVQVDFRGALKEFPYDHGEGVFRIAVDVEDGIFDYAEGWPRVENLSTHLVFDGVSVSVPRSSGRLGGIPFDTADARIGDLRQGLVEISADQSVEFNQMLTFLRSSPVAEALGPTFLKVRGSGMLDTELQLTLPIKRLDEYELKVTAAVEDTVIDLDGLDFGFSAVNGSVTILNTKVYADAITAQLLEEPVTIRIRPAADDAGLYTHFVNVAGNTPVVRWMETLGLPFAEYFQGELAWGAMALIPARREDIASPLHILVRSDLTGVASALPVPLAKEAPSAAPLELDIAFPEDDVLEVTGKLRREITWAMRLNSSQEVWEIERGAVHAGSAAALLPIEPGIELSGHLETLRFDDWLALQDGTEESTWMELYREAIFEIDRLFLFGRAFSDVEVHGRRLEDDWQIDLDSPNIAGQISVPLIDTEGRPIIVNMDRAWLVEDDPVESDDTDPRNIQSAEITIRDFVLSDMHFGSLNVNLQTVSAGVIADPIKMEAEPFRIEGDAAWLVHPNDDSVQQSQMRLDLEGNDIKATLLRLGYDPVIEGKVAKVSAELTWPGAPSDDFLFRADGTLKVRMEEGALLEVQPGGGRLLGVLSVAALPRRLSLDFRDVFDEGLSFDVMSGDFIIQGGNAYTCNLGLEGSVADLGVVGRAGIEAEDYDQLALVRPHVSNVFALGGAVVGGPAVGAAMLLFSEIFRKPLSSLGESFYRVTGSWDDPAIERIQGDELDLTPLKNCERYLETEMPNLQP